MEDSKQFEKRQEELANTSKEDFKSMMEEHSPNKLDDSIKRQPMSDALTALKDFHEKEVVSNKQLRKDIDTQIQILSNLTRSRERSLAITKLEEAVMWLGMDLKRLGEANPYPSSKDPNTGSKIEPTADGLKFSSGK